VDDGSIPHDTLMASDVAKSLLAPRSSMTLDRLT